MTTRTFLLYLGCFTILTGPALAQKFSAMGHWEFDPARKQEFVKAVRATQANNSMSEIAAQMGMARVQNTMYQFGVDKFGPYLSVFDKTTNKQEMHYITVKLSKDGMLHVSGKRSGSKFRLSPIDADHITFYDDDKNHVIPLKRM